MDEQEHLRAIANTPNDEQVARNYAGWLLERGDRRGEFLRLVLDLRAAERMVSSLKQTLESGFPPGGIDPVWLDMVIPLFITSPMVGTFYSASSPDAAPFLKVGDACIFGAPIGIIEAMKVFNEIPADISGIVSEVLVENGDAVEYGQALFRVRRLPRLLAGG